MKTMRYSTLRKKFSEQDTVDPAIRPWDCYTTEADDDGGADDSSVCSCSDSSLKEDEMCDVGKVDFRELGFTVFDVPGELRGRRGFETAEKLERKEGGGGGSRKTRGGVGSYYGAMLSGATGAAFGAVSMGVLMVRYFGCFHHAEYLGVLTPT